MPRLEHESSKAPNLLHSYFLEECESQFGDREGFPSDRAFVSKFHDWVIFNCCCFTSCQRIRCLSAFELKLALLKLLDCLAEGSQRLVCSVISGMMVVDTAIFERADAAQMSCPLDHTKVNEENREWIANGSLET